MTILGIDPGTATVGYGIIRYEEGKLRPVDVGVILTPSTWTMQQRLLSIYNDINELLDRYKPDTVACERLFFSKNVTNALTVGQAVGVIQLAFWQRELECFEYTPMQVKMAVTGYGGAEKHQIEDMVVKLLSLAAPPKPDDAADALAVAICHAHSYKLRALNMASRRGASS